MLDVLVIAGEEYDFHLAAEGIDTIRSGFEAKLGQPCTVRLRMRPGTPRPILIISDRPTPASTAPRR